MQLVASSEQTLSTSSPVAANSADGFPNTRSGAYPVIGDGTIFMDIIKNTDAGVLFDLQALGGGLRSVNEMGTLFLPRVRNVFAEFSNNDNARTEFEAPVLIYGGVHISGVGGESFPTDGICNTGNESGVYFQQPATIREELNISNSDDPTTVGCVEGATFDASAVRQSKLLLSAPSSTVDGVLNMTGASGITLLSSRSTSHNLLLTGDLTASGTPTFEFQLPFQGSTQCVNPQGNALIFSGGNNPQTINSGVPLNIPAVQIEKDNASQAVIIDDTSSEVTISQSFEILTGIFTSNNRLSNSSVAPSIIPDDDNDGVVNVCDECNGDSLKSTPGVCGCGVPDVDQNNNGQIDCVESTEVDLTSTSLGKPNLSIEGKTVTISLSSIGGVDFYTCTVRNIFKNKKGKKKRLTQQITSGNTELVFTARKRPSVVRVSCFAANGVSQSQTTPVAKGKIKKRRKR